MIAITILIPFPTFLRHSCDIFLSTSFFRLRRFLSTFDIHSFDIRHSFFRLVTFFLPHSGPFDGVQLGRQFGVGDVPRTFAAVDGATFENVARPECPGNPFFCFLNLKDFCRCLTDFSPLYLLHWGFRAGPSDAGTHHHPMLQRQFRTGMASDRKGKILRLDDKY